MEKTQHQIYSNAIEEIIKIASGSGAHSLDVYVLRDIQKIHDITKEILKAEVKPPSYIGVSFVKDEELISLYTQTEAIQIYDEKGYQINPIPENTKCIVYCDNEADVSGWIPINSLSDLGLEFFIAKSWLKMDELVDYEKN